MIHFSFSFFFLDINMKTYFFNILRHIKIKLKIILVNITLAKFISTLCTIMLAASIKYIISGNFVLEYKDFLNNVVLGLLTWTINFSLIILLTDYLGIKDINFNLKEFLFGFNVLKSPSSSLDSKSVIKFSNFKIRKGELNNNEIIESNDSDNANTAINNTPSANPPVSPVSPYQASFEVVLREIDRLNEMIEGGNTSEENIRIQNDAVIRATQIFHQEQANQAAAEQAAAREILREFVLREQERLARSQEISSELREEINQESRESINNNDNNVNNLNRQPKDSENFDD